MNERAEDLLRRYADLVRAWAPRLDLVSDQDLPHLEDRHIADSLRLLPLLEREGGAGPAVDVGSGAGLPGIPLAIATEGRMQWLLLEPRKNRAAFLEEAVRELGLAVQVHVATAEQTAVSLADTHSVAVARALAPPPDALALLRPLVRPGGIAVLMIGKEATPPQGASLWEPGVAVWRAT